MTDADPLDFTDAEYESRLAGVRRAMARAGLDALVVSDPSNMAWLTGYDGWSFYVHQAVIVGPDGPPVWFGREQDAQGALRTCYMREPDLIFYPDHYVQTPDRHPMDYLAARLAERGWRRGRVGVEMDNYWFSAKAHQALSAGLAQPPADAAGLVNWARAVKSPTELERMRRAGRIVERMHARVAERVEPGMRQCDLVAEIYDSALRYDPALGHGGDYPAIVPLLAAGSDAAAPHLTWSDKPLRTGEGAFFELAGCFRRYHCPLSRTVFLGKPPQHFLDAEKAVLEGLEAGLEQARAGKLCEDIANAFFAVLKRHGVEKNNRTGYPIGLSYPPDWGERTCSLRPGDRTMLRPGMTFHFMTGLWMQDWGFEITESLVIGETGPELLATVPRAMLVKP